MPFNPQAQNQVPELIMRAGEQFSQGIGGGLQSFLAQRAKRTEQVRTDRQILKIMAKDPESGIDPDDVEGMGAEQLRGTRMGLEFKSNELSQRLMRKQRESEIELNKFRMQHEMMRQAQEAEQGRAVENDFQGFIQSLGQSPLNPSQPAAQRLDPNRTIPSEAYATMLLPDRMTPEQRAAAQNIQPYLMPSRPTQDSLGLLNLLGPERAQPGAAPGPTNAPARPGNPVLELLRRFPGAINHKGFPELMRAMRESGGGEQPDGPISFEEDPVSGVRFGRLGKSMSPSGVNPNRAAGGGSPQVIEDDEGNKFTENIDPRSGRRQLIRVRDPRRVPQGLHTEFNAALDAMPERPASDKAEDVTRFERQSARIRQRAKDIVDGYFATKDIDEAQRDIFYKRLQPKGGAPASGAAGGKAIPQGAVDRLKANPKLAEDFDAAFGPGAARRVLGK